MTTWTENVLDGRLNEEFEDLGITDQPQSAICLSGGGIRSAAFCLGVLQSLASKKALGKFKYLSTVSGGGYIGSWLTSRLNCEELSNVEEELGENSPDMIRELRGASRYLTPRAGVWSLDTWMLIGTYLRNLVLNWAVIVPFAVAGAAIVNAVPWLVSEELAALLAASGFSSATPLLEHSIVERAFVLGPPGLVVLIGLFVAFVQAKLPNKKPGGLHTFGAYWLRASVFWLVITAMVVYGPRMLPAAWTIALTIGSGLVTAAMSRLSSGPSAVTEEIQRIRDIATAIVIRLAAVIFILALIACLSWLASKLAAILPGSPANHVGIAYLYVAVIGIAISGILSFVVDVNDYSLHGLYRDRLIKRFIHKKVDIPLEDLDPKNGRNPKACLFHVLNATVNCSKAYSVDRMGFPFSFTAMHCGYKEPDNEAIFDRSANSKLTLGTAMAISGAAANPNMGYFSSALIRFPMALLNMRLGWWLPRPTKKAKATRAADPFTAGKIWKAEFLGIKDHTTDSFINLSDGGHVDNLGLYEMIRRRCARVLVVDAGADPKRQYQDLANVVRRVRIDFGVEITINGLKFGESSAENVGSFLPIYKGTIRYPDKNVEDGTLIIVRPEPHPSEPMDISAYGSRHTAFPHESTADQWFSEAQFESYRKLGEFTINNAISFYLSDKGPSAKDNLPTTEDNLLKSEHGIFTLLAESAYRMSRGVTLPSHAGGILYEQLGRGQIGFVLVRSAPNSNWVLPKGHIEAGESPEGAAKREVEEETGYRVTTSEPFNIETFPRDGEDIRVEYFLMDITDKTPGPSDEKRDLMRLVYKSKARPKLVRADKRSWDATDSKLEEWESTDQKTEVKLVPDDVLKLLKGVARLPRLRRPDGSDTPVENP